MAGSGRIKLPKTLPLATPRDAILLRICDTNYAHHEPSFRAIRKYRFDDPDAVFSTLYCAPSFVTCYYETVVRGTVLDQRTQTIPISRAYNDSRSLVQVVADLSTLRLVKLMDDGAAQMGLDASILMGASYRRTQAISRALYEHSDNVHGAVYRSRYDMQSTAIVLFDRAKAYVRLYPASQPISLTRLDELLSPLKALPVPIALV